MTKFKHKDKVIVINPDWNGAKEGVLYRKGSKDSELFPVKLENGMTVGFKASELALASDYLNFGDVARNQMGQQCQYACRYFDAVWSRPDSGGYKFLGSNLRILGDSRMYHSMKIHKDDVAEAVVRYKNRDNESVLNPRIVKALDYAMRYGQIDGGHHKNWVIDQMIRALTGCKDEKTQSDEYQKFVAEAKNGKDGPNTYDWDTGICP